MAEIRLSPGERIVVTELGQAIIFEPLAMSDEQIEHEIECAEEFFRAIRRPPTS